MSKIKFFSPPCFVLDTNFYFGHDETAENFIFQGFILSLEKWEKA